MNMNDLSLRFKQKIYFPYVLILKTTTLIRGIYLLLKVLLGLFLLKEIFLKKLLIIFDQ